MKRLKQQIVRHPCSANNLQLLDNKLLKISDGFCLPNKSGIQFFRNKGKKEKWKSVRKKLIFLEPLSNNLKNNINNVII